jgi:hypothetical protein
MAYKPGALKVKDHDCIDQPSDHACDHPWHVGEMHAYLPHSCDEWEIGGIQEVLALITDLQGALDILCR